MAMNTRFGKIAAATYSAPSGPASLTAAAATITWTTNEPTASYTYTIADGSAPTSTELGIALATSNAQITALITDVTALRTALLASNVSLAASAVDVAACKTLLDDGL